MQAAKEKFLALDALRGLGAILVVTAHIAVNEKVPFFQNGAPAVDMFFVLSGFVIAHSYEEALQTTMTFKKYFRIRMIRLYPMVLLGGLVGFASMAIVGHKQDYDIWSALPLQLALIPMLKAGLDAYPLNPPHWSLFFELFANFAHAAVAKKATDAAIKIVMGISFVALVYFAFRFGSLNVGTRGENFLGGFARIGFSFPLGLLIYRLYSRGVRMPSLPFIVPFGGLCAIIILPAPALPYAGAIHNLLAVCVILPALLFVAANVKLSQRWEPICNWLGLMSYPLYALHVPILHLLAGPLLAPGVPHWLKALGWGGVICVCVLIATLVTYFIDAPVRAWLSKVTKGRAKIAPKIAPAN